MGPVVDVRPGAEAPREIQSDDPDDLPDRLRRSADPFQADPEDPDEPEDRAAGPGADGARVHPGAQPGSSDAAQEVDEEEPTFPQPFFERGAEYVQRPSIEGD